MIDLYIGFMIALNFVFLLFAVPMFFNNFKKFQLAIPQIENLKENIKTQEQIIEMSERIKKLEDINQKMSKYLDTVENRLQSLKSEV